MLPEFPQFKKLEVSDKTDIEAVTGDYPPYSDFNFTSMWSWNIKGEMEVSCAGKNLVMKFTDYVTGKPFYSFLGTEKPSETASALLQHSVREGLKPMMKLLPEISVKQIDHTLFAIKEDPDNFDYVLSVEKIKHYQGSAYEKKRNDVRRFTKRHQFRVEVLDVRLQNIHHKILESFHAWMEEKDITVSEAQNELAALKRFFLISANLDLVTVAIFSGNTIIAFWITEVVGNGYAISHFEKAHSSFAGVYAYLKQQTASALSERGIEYVNLEQDLGISGLRANKESYYPHEYLKKFSLTSL